MHNSLHSNKLCPSFDTLLIHAGNLSPCTVLSLKGSRFHPTPWRRALHKQQDTHGAIFQIIGGASMHSRKNAHTEGRFSSSQLHQFITYCEGQYYAHRCWQCNCGNYLFFLNLPKNAALEYLSLFAKKTYELLLRNRVLAK